MKKKILAVCLVVALIATLAISGTYAYLTDKDDAKNVMELGRVDITQNELQRNDAGKIEDPFVQEQMLYPAVNLIPQGEGFVVEQNGVSMFNEGLHNEIDKFVNVTVEENSKPCYIRTILAFETKISYVENSDDEIDANLHEEFFLVNGTFDYLYVEQKPMIVTIDGVDYWLAVCVYKNEATNDIFSAGDTTPYSLRQIALTWDVGNNAMDWFGAEYNILCLSQAVQAAGFETVGAEVALNTAFGEVNASNAASWLAAVAAAEVN